MTARPADRWGMTTFGRLARIGNGADYSSVEVEEGGYPVYGSGGEFRRAPNYLFDGESVLFGRKGTVDRPLYVDGKFWTVDTMFYSVIDQSRLLPRFAYYWATTLPFGAWATDTALPSMTSTAIKAAPIALPSVPEQRAIADYLDRETAQIDAFIAKNEELITLLTERRNSVWSDLYMEAASTVRLAPLRRFVLSIVDGPFGSSLTSAHYSEAGTRVIRLGNVGINEFKAGDEAFISDDYAATLAAHAALPGDVIVAGLGDDRMPLGRACVLPDIGPAIVKADCYRVRPTPSVSPAFLAWVLSAPPTRGLMKLAARGSTRERLNTSVVLDIEVPIPTEDLQTELVERFATSAATIDEARGVAERGVSLARERRAALISAAVTGKIDVGVAV